MRIYPAIIATALISNFPAPVAAQATSPERVVDAVVAGMNCKQWQTPTSLQMDCEFKVGKSLYFSIVGVGEGNAAVTVFHSDWKGDYYISVGGVHGCAIVKEGEALPEAMKGSTLPAVAFVSPKTGKVYRDWQGCAGAT